MAELSIGSVAERAGIATSAIRYYESVGLLPAPARRSGRRVYDEAVFDRLSFIEVSKTAGFTVAEMLQLVRGFSRKTPPGPRWRALADDKLEELDRRIDEAQRMQKVLRALTSCGCPSFDECARALRD